MPDGKGKYNMSYKALDNERKTAVLKTRHFNPNAKSRWGVLYKTLQPQTKEYLSHKNITIISKEKTEKLKDLALSIRNNLISNKASIFADSLIEYYNRAGIVMDQIKNPNDRTYSKYYELFNSEEEMALFIMFLIDPDLDYYNDYVRAEDNKLKILDEKHGFVSKELLEIERLYDFVIRYRQKGYDDDKVEHLATKLFNLDSSRGR